MGEKPDSIAELEHEIRARLKISVAAADMRDD
jgi:hypothetical protein